MTDILAEFVRNHSFLSFLLSGFAMMAAWGIAESLSTALQRPTRVEHIHHHRHESPKSDDSDDSDDESE